MKKKLLCPFIGTLFTSFLSVQALASQDQRQYQPSNPFSGQHQNQGNVHNSYLPVHKARQEKRSHEEKLQEEKSQKKSRWSGISLKKHKEKMEHKWHKKKKWKKKREQMKLKFGEEYRYKYANKITQCAVRMMEKHYAGTASFIEGAGFLKELRAVMAPISNVRSDLELLYERCNDVLTIYKKDKKEKKIERVKNFSVAQKHDLDQELNRIFPYENDLIGFLKEAYSSDMNCHNPKGFTVGGAAGLGGYLGFYRQKCRTPLGRRYTIYKIHGGLNYGIGGAVSTSLAGSFTRHPKVPMHSTPNSVKFDHYGVAALGVGPAEHVTVPGGSIKKVFQSEKSAKDNISRADAHVTPAVGLGICLGLAGASGESKEETKPDFDRLFTEMKLYHRGG